MWFKKKKKEREGKESKKEEDEEGKPEEYIKRVSWRSRRAVTCLAVSLHPLVLPFWFTTEGNCPRETVGRYGAKSTISAGVVNNIFGLWGNRQI